MEEDDTGWTPMYAQMQVHPYDRQLTGSPFIWVLQSVHSAKIVSADAPDREWDLAGPCTKLTAFLVNFRVGGDGRVDGDIMYEIRTAHGTWSILVRSRRGRREYYRLNHTCPQMQFCGTYFLMHLQCQTIGRNIGNDVYHLTMNAAGEQAEMVLLKWDLYGEAESVYEASEAYSTDRERLSDEDSGVNFETDESMPRDTDEEHFGTDDEDSDDDSTDDSQRS